jgi:hypothetical protein
MAKDKKLPPFMAKKAAGAKGGDAYPKGKTAPPFKKGGKK